MKFKIKQEEGKNAKFWLLGLTIEVCQICNCRKFVETNQKIRKRNVSTPSPKKIISRFFFQLAREVRNYGALPFCYIINFLLLPLPHTQTLKLSLSLTHTHIYILFLSPLCPSSSVNFFLSIKQPLSLFHYIRDNCNLAMCLVFGFNLKPILDNDRQVASKYVA